MNVRTTQQSGWRAYSPLIALYGLAIVFAFLAGWAVGISSVSYFALTFMGVSYLVLGVLKVLHIKQFVARFRLYDITAAQSTAYAYAYPVIELLLGAALLTGYEVRLALAVSLILAVLGMASVIMVVRARANVENASCGAGFGIPLTSVSLVEYTVFGFLACYLLLTYTAP